MSASPSGTKSLSSAYTNGGAGYELLRKFHFLAASLDSLQRPRGMIVDVKLKIELNNGGRVVSLDEFIKTFLEAMQRAVRQEFQRLQIPRAPAEEPASTSVPESRRTLAVSKTEAPEFSVSAAARSTTALCPSKSPCFASAAESSCPFQSLEAAVRRGSLQTGRRDMNRETP